jgi:hypothetical protein
LDLTQINHDDLSLQVIKSNDSGNWTLQIKYPQIRDSGVYECQINTEPKMSLSYTLNVLGKLPTPFFVDLQNKCFFTNNLLSKVIFFPPKYKRKFGGKKIYFANERGPFLEFFWSFLELFWNFFRAFFELFWSFLELFWKFFVAFLKKFKIKNSLKSVTNGFSVPK